MRIIAFDPGGTTGVAIYDDQKEVPEISPWWRFSLGHGEHHSQLWHTLLTEGPFDAVVYETFNYQRRALTQGVALSLISCEYIGIIKLAHERHRQETNTLVDQSPSLRSFWTDERLRKLSLWRSSEHERDATRHLLYYLSFTLKDQRFINKLK